MKYLHIVSAILIVSFIACNQSTQDEKDTPVTEKTSIPSINNAPVKTQKQLDDEEVSMEKAEPLKYLRTSATYDQQGNDMTAHINVYNSAFFVAYHKVSVTVNFLKKDKSVAKTVNYPIPEAVKPHASYADSYLIKDIPAETDRIKVKITSGEAMP